MSRAKYKHGSVIKSGIRVLVQGAEVTQKELRIEETRTGRNGSVCSHQAIRTVMR